MKKLDFPGLSALLLWFLASAPAHPQDIEWEKSYGGKHSDYLFDAIPTADYGFLLAGSSLSKKTGNKAEDGNGDLDYFLWKMDEKGELDWQKSFGGPGADLLQCVKHSKDGGFILAGTSDSPAGLGKKDPCRGKEDFWIIKLDAKGNEEWQRTIGGSGQELLQGIAPAADGGYIIGGSSSSPRSGLLPEGKEDLFGKSGDSRGSLDYWVVKLDRKGNIEWQKTIGGSYADHLRIVRQTRDGGCMLGGSSNSPESGEKSGKCYGESDYWVVKLDRSGAIEWQKAYGGEGDDQLYALIQSQDGNYVMGGSSNSGATGNKSSSSKNGTDFWVLKIDEKGEMLWQETYDIGKADLLASIAEDIGGSLLLAGYALSEASGTKKKDREGISDYVAVKTDAGGQEQWRQSAGSGGEDMLRRAVRARDGGYILAGTSRGAPSRDRYSGIGRNDFWVVKLRDSDKKKEEKNPIEAIPNPTARFSNIIIGYEFETGTASVYDLAGRQLQQFEIMDRTVPVDLDGLPEGVYLVEIRTDVQNNTVKVAKTGSNN